MDENAKQYAEWLALANAGKYDQLPKDYGKILAVEPFDEFENEVYDSSSPRDALQSYYFSRPNSETPLRNETTRLPNQATPLLGGDTTPIDKKRAEDEGGILGGLRSFTRPIGNYARDLFNDPARMALLYGGMQTRESGFLDGLGTGIKTYQTLSEPRKLGFREQERIRQANAVALNKQKHANILAQQADKAKYLVPKTTKDVNNRLRYSSGKTSGDLVYPNLTVAPESMDANQIFGAEFKLGKDFNVMIGGKLAQVEAYRRIEAIYDDPFRPDPLVDNPTVEGPNGPIKIDTVLKKDGDVFKLEAGGAADLALIFNFMKMLDPASVVRESEFALAEATGALPDWLKKEWSKVTDGGRLTPTMRRNIMRQARTQYDSAEQNIATKHKEYVKRAEQYKDWGIKADRALLYTPYEPTITASQFAPAVTVAKAAVPPVDPNNPLNLNLPLNKGS